MELYASPMACSLASHIAAYEADLPVTIHYVNGTTKQTDDGRDYLEIAPNGYVPALRLPSGEVLNEGPSVLQWLADQKPEAKLAPAWGSIERYLLIDTLNYLSTEVHKRVFYPIFAPAVPAETKAAAQAQLAQTLDAIARRLGDRPVLVGDNFSVADAYLVTLLNWFRYLKVDLARWPALEAYHQRHLARPAVARAIAEEMGERKKRAA
jgi:glutathione S-transferase